MESIERKLPDDFSQNKEKLLADLTERKRMDAWGDYLESLRGEAAISYEDPEMLAYQALQQGDQEEAIAKLEQAAETAGMERDLGAASVFYQLATLYASRNEWEKAAEAYGDAGDSLLARGREVLPGGRAQALLGMGRSYENLGEIEEAVMWYTAASDSTGVPSLHLQLQMTFERLGQDELVARETQWLADYEQRQKEQQEALAAQQKAMEEQQARPRPPEADEAE
jgi:tetratricopeptide (TPR) repeat protein